MITNFECICRTPFWEVLSVEVAEAKPGVACLWLKDAATAIGRLRDDRRTDGRVRRNAEANSLIVSLYRRDFDVEYVLVGGYRCWCQIASLSSRSTKDETMRRQ